MAQHPHLRRHDVELLADHLAEAFELHSVMRAGAFRFRERRWTTDAETGVLIRELARMPPDVLIAGLLNRLGKKAGKGNSWTKSRVCSFRSRRTPSRHRPTAARRPAPPRPQTGTRLTSHADIHRLLPLTGCRRNENLGLRTNEVDGDIIALEGQRPAQSKVYLYAGARRIIERQHRGQRRVRVSIPAQFGEPA